MHPLQQLLIEHCNAKIQNIHEIRIPDCPMSFLQLRDRLCHLGTILHEDRSQQIYVVSIRSGFADLNQATVALQLQDRTLIAMGYAREGLIPQHTCEGALQKLADAVHGASASGRSRKLLILLLSFMALIIVCFIALQARLMTGPEFPQQTEDSAFAAEVQLALDATKRYNEAVEQFNARVSAYNQAVSLTSIDNLEGMPPFLDTLVIVSEDPEDIRIAVSGGNSAEIIGRDIQTITEMTAQAESLLAVVKQITAPSPDWVMDRLSDVSAITGSQAVNESNDPDGLLGKEGGYAACVYFTVSAIDPDEIPGTSIVAKGTDAGGAVEIYNTLEEARARREYLSGFDGTILYSGSYAILGTMVIRTSYKLTNEQQLAFTRMITEKLTALPTA